ncbi:hypothetical protein [Occallatibacter savannae]|uniref:hypothetical protein n=1 Tax=Occallatibacter savannae TaxID=1002691 RepID=UPI000D694DAF|nr:hypothetical protein [Occallatibacter savannae]
MSPRQSNELSTKRTSLALILGLIASAASAQYPGQIEKKSKDGPTLRAVAVLEWTGDLGKPKKSRLVPISIYDGQELHDASIYMARPHPMALAGEVEYELQRNGAPIGLFDIKNAAQEMGSWVGYGSWKATPSAKPTAPKQIVDTGFDANDDKPVLHRKHSDTSAKSDSTASASSPDSDRPTLHKPTTEDTSSKSDPAPDPDRPTLHKEKAPADSDNPVLHKHSGTDTSDGEHASFTDPDRPRLMRGKQGGANGLDVLPSLLGLPPDMNQAVAVSDSKSRQEHTWDYKWANPDDEDKMKAALEDIARTALGLKTPPPPPATRRAAAHKAIKPSPAPEPPPLVDEKFRVLELAYGSGATMVFSAHTDDPEKTQKFVTLIAQPDLYGNPLVLLKNVTDAAHLDQTPQMRLVDAVDALADNRGELLFELRGAGQRQFALYRVLRGTAEKIFVTGGGEFGVAPGE